mgnify:CR=1 FL=1
MWGLVVACISENPVKIESENNMEIIKLIGVLVVIVGLTLRLDTLATVVVAGVLTGFVAGTIGDT